MYTYEFWGTIDYTVSSEECGPNKSLFRHGRNRTRVVNIPDFDIRCTEAPGRVFLVNQAKSRGNSSVTLMLMVSSLSIPHEYRTDECIRAPTANAIHILWFPAIARRLWDYEVDRISCCSQNSIQSRIRHHADLAKILHKFGGVDLHFPRDSDSNRVSRPGVDLLEGGSHLEAYLVRIVMTDKRSLMYALIIEIISH